MDNVHNFQCKETIRSEARAWVLKFNQDIAPTDDDILNLRAWTERSPVHRAELEFAEQCWVDADLLSELAVPTPKRETKRAFDPWGVLSNPIRSLSSGGGMAIAASLGIVVTVALLLLKTPSINESSIYETTIGEQQVVLLPDNSRMHLDTNSKIEVNFSDDIRAIRLLRGKAHFEVQKDSNRPFDVYAGGGSARAVGTAFSVYLSNREMQVTVTEGIVELARIDASDVTEKAPESIPRRVLLSMERGQSATLNKGQVQLSNLKDKELDREMSWKKGLLIFAGDPLHKVISEVNRYTDVTIEISDPELRDLAIGGRFRIGELDALFDALTLGFNVEVSYVDDSHIQLQASTLQ
jgi:transmembrane sensor